MSTPWVSVEPEPVSRGLFSGPNLQAAGASIALPGSGHLIRERRAVGVIWSLFSLLFYASFIFFRVAQDARVFFGMGIAALLLSCAAGCDCCLRGSSESLGRMLGFLVLLLLASGIWANGICYMTALAAGFRYFTVPSMSMEPTIPKNDWVLVDVRYFQDQKPRCGDIVVMDHKFPNNPGLVRVMKRVEGVPGDVVKIVDGKLIRNGVPIEENYVMHSNGPEGIEWLKNMPPRTIPPSRLFLLGDNRENSFDSRAPEVGNYPESELSGKVLRVVRWPWKVNNQ
jgi:signal peptidase I